MIIKCENCSKNINRSQWRLNSYKHQFCSKKCADSFLVKDKISHLCKTCGKEFFFLPSRLKYSDKKYCSAKCSWEDKKKGSVSQCLICNKNIYSSPSERKDGRGKFCSKECVAKSQTGINGTKYKTGYSLFKKYSKTLKNKECVLCKSIKQIDLHHKDGNKQNNIQENWVLLCRQCHMRIHKLVSRFNISHEQAFNILLEDKIYNMSSYIFANYAPSDELLTKLGVIAFDS